MNPRDEARRAATEDRLRAALSARAALLTPHDLRREAPPRGREWGVRRARAVAFAVLGAVAAVVAVCLLVLYPGSPLAPTPAPVPPARPPAVSDPPPPLPRPSESATPEPARDPLTSAPSGSPRPGAAR